MKQATVKLNFNKELCDGSIFHIIILAKIVIEQGDHLNFISNFHTYLITFYFYLSTFFFLYFQRQGCIHGEDLPYLFGAPLVGGFSHFTRNYTKTEINLSEVVMLYWSNFVRTG